MLFAIEDRPASGRTGEYPGKERKSPAASIIYGR